MAVKFHLPKQKYHSNIFIYLLIMDLCVIYYVKDRTSKYSTMNKKESNSILIAKTTQGKWYQLILNKFKYYNTS